MGRNRVPDAKREKRRQAQPGDGPDRSRQGEAPRFDAGRILWADQAWEDYLWWQAQDPRILARVNALIDDALRSPFEGIGKPEPLRHGWSGYWSRRITREHRLVYRSGNGMVFIAQCRFHY